MVLELNFFNNRAHVSTQTSINSVYAVGNSLEMNTSKRQKIDYELTDSVPWDMLYLGLALECEIPILKAMAKAMYRKETNPCHYGKGFTVEYYRGNSLHCDDGPAVLHCADVNAVVGQGLHWYQYGLLLKTEIVSIKLN
jgi:hypothetical protein